MRNLILKMLVLMLLLTGRFAVTGYASWSGEFANNSISSLCEDTEDDCDDDDHNDDPNEPGGGE